jgi:hypothetical protein
VDWLSRSTTKTSINLSAHACNGANYNYQVQAVCPSGPSIPATGSFLTNTCVPACSGLPTRHYTSDLGDIGIAGQSCLLSTPTIGQDIIQVNGSGKGIGGSSDQFQYAFLQYLGDEYIIAKIQSQSNATNAFNKAGLMMRDSLSTDSRFIFVGLNSGNKMIVVYRATPGGQTDSVVLAGPYAAPYWVKLFKSGTQYSAFISPDGTIWNQIGTTQNLGFGSTTVVNTGMAVSSSSNSILSTATFDFFDPVNPLPITLVNFTASDINNEYVYLQWATAMEVNNDRFEIERSTNGVDFQRIATVKAFGNSDITRYYTTRDANPVQGINYYRLKQVDLDGKFTNSPIRLVNFGKLSGPITYPNPTTSFFNIVAGAEAIQSVSVYTPQGKLIKQVENSEGASSLKISLDRQAAGVYVVRISTVTQVYYQKVLKQ